MTARGGVIAHWRDDLENLVSDGEERVAESEHLDVGVAVAQLQTEFLGDTGLHRRQIMGDQCDLAKSHPHAPTVAGSYARAPDRLHPPPAHPRRPPPPPSPCAPRAPR